MWMKSNDKILAMLATDLINRNIFKVEVYEEPVGEEKLNALREEISRQAGISNDDARYLMSVNTIEKDMYDIHDDQIGILYKDGTIRDIAESSEILNINLLSRKVRKYYLCYQRF